jgi:hypothetical protein
MPRSSERNSCRQSLLSLKFFSNSFNYFAPQKGTIADAVSLGRCKACNLKVLIHDTSCCQRYSSSFLWWAHSTIEVLYGAAGLKSILFNYFILNKDNTEWNRCIVWNLNDRKGRGRVLSDQSIHLHLFRGMSASFAMLSSSSLGPM